MSTAIADPQRQARIEALRKKYGGEPSGLSAPSREFKSARNAKPMQPGDISNVRLLTTNEESAFMRRLRLASPKLHATLLEAADELWDTWPDGDSRWGLTPHAARKLNPLRTVKTT